MRHLGLICALCLVATHARAQEAAPEPGEAPAPVEAEVPAGGDAEVAGEAAPALPPPTLEGEEPVAAPEPLPTPDPEEEEQPEILSHIGSGDHPEWEPDDDEGALPRDYAHEIPGDMRSNVGPNAGGARLESYEPEEPTPPFVLAAGAGWARYLAAQAIDFFRIDERFEVTIPEFATFRLGASATQMFSDAGYLVGGGIRLGMGVPLCDTGDIVCDGQVFVQPGFLAGLTGPRFDLNGLLSLRFIFGRVAQVAVEGGYSLLFDGVSIVSVSGLAGVVF